MSTLLTRRQVWTLPVSIGLVSAFGLTSALLFDGPGDVVSWLLMLLPAGVGLWGLRVLRR